jgi:phosphohistidine swiveling domain-containing protein
MKKDILSNFQKINDWVKVWSGRWSLHFDSHIGNDWTQNLKVSSKRVFTHVIYFYHNAITDCWVSGAEKDYLGERLCKLARKDPNFILNLCKQFKLSADEVTTYLNSHDPEKMSTKDLSIFWDMIGRYYLPHLSVKYMVDYLSSKELKKYLPILEEARLYAEPIFRNSEDFFEKFAQKLAKKNHYPKDILFASTGKEIESYFKNNKLPSKKLLRARFIQSSLIIEKAKQQLYVGKEVDQIEKIVNFHAFEGSLSGQTAYEGKVKGHARIVLNPKEYTDVFNKGDILVTGMTRPEFLPLMKKSAAFVTDAGGILSHAAIMARELKKPAVIGTKNATRVFKDGDLVEVDANKGIIRKVKGKK